MGSKDELHNLFNKIVGSEIAKIRTDTNVGQEDFARKACVSRQWVSRFETGKSGMNLYNNGFAGGVIAIFMVPVMQAVRDRRAKAKGDAIL